MKNYKSLSMALSLATFTLVGLAPNEAGAQGIKAEVMSGFAAMKAGEWEKSRSIFSKLTSSLGEDKGRKQFGSKFGEIYYYQGLSELQAGNALKSSGGEANLKKADEMYHNAAKSFEMSYKFPSKDGKKNKFEKSCLYQQAQALQKLRKYDAALQLHEKYQEERKSTDKVNPGAQAISMAICYFKQEDPDFRKGINFFEIALKNKKRWKVQDGAVVKAFQALTEAAIKVDNEQALLDFLQQNRAAITLKPRQMVQFTPFFQKLGSQTMAEGMSTAAFNIFALVPDTQVALADMLELKTAIADYPLDDFNDGDAMINKAQLGAREAKLREKKSAGDPPEVFALTATAFTHEKNGYVRGAMAAYKNLELYFSGSAKREDNLYHLVRTSSLLGDVPQTVKYGKTFLQRFPSSKHATAVSNVMLSSLFADAKYEEAEKVAGDLLDTLDKPSLPHDVCLYVLGGSKFSLGKYAEAKTLLADHVKMYPESESSLAVAYFEASNLARLNQMSEAASKLDAFIAKYPDAAKNPYLPFALYDRAKMHYAADENAAAVKLLLRVQGEFDSAKIADSSFVLLGDVQKSDEQIDKAKAAYQKAFERSKTNRNREVSSEALYKLVTLLGSKGTKKKPNAMIKEAVPFYDIFMKDYVDSPYRLQVARVGVAALVASDRAQEALDNLESAISNEAKKQKPFGVERAVKAYTREFVAVKEAAGMEKVAATDALRSKYLDFKGIAADDVATRSMLELEIIGMYQLNLAAARKAKNDDLVAKNEGRIASAFKNLKKNFPVEQLSASGLMNVGDYLLKSSASPRQALPYFEERLKRSEKKGLEDAVFGVAEVYSLAGKDSELRKGIESMIKVQKQSADDKKAFARASAILVDIYFKQKNWAKVVEAGSEFLAKGGKGSTKLRVTQRLAEAYLEQKNYAKCIELNVNLYVNNKPKWHISVPAVERATTLMYKHGSEVKGKSRQQAAYDMASGFIKSSRAAFEANKLEMDAEVREAWLGIDARLKTWENEGIIEVAPAN